MQTRISSTLTNPNTPSRRSWTEFDAAALIHNFEIASAQVGSEKRVMAVVKANGYGHSAAKIALTLAGKVHSFGVACVGEAERLRASGIEDPVYLLSPVLPSEVARVVAGGFRPTISTALEGHRFNDEAQRADVKLPVQWVLDTGMGRAGTLPSEIQSMAKAWSEWPNLKLESISSHFPSADEDSDFTLQQLSHFHSRIAELEELGIRPEFVHVANSAGLLGFPIGSHEIVRAGLVLYGISPLPEFQCQLQPVITWKTRVTLVRELPENWGVSYGRTFITHRPTLVATLAVGYADGYPRHLSNRGADVLIHGTHCPLLGRVTMDQLVVDVSHLASPPQPGAEAVILGKQGSEEISALELAEKSGTIPWEIFTSMHPD